MSQTRLTKAQISAVIVAALGYFVDVYDLLLFSIVRVPSLQDLGYTGEQLLSLGSLVLNAQMAGMLVGGIVWGVWGDKKGRLSVLFGSILMYSLANIANGFVTGIGAYAVLRFIAGVGLAGELGAGITLVAEIMPQQKRGLATTIVATVGVLGAIAAALVGDLFPWRTAFFIGGGLGLSLLVLRISVRESGMFEAVGQQAHVRRGDLVLLLKSRERFKRYFNSILAGLPIWCVLGVLITFSPELGKAMGIVEPVSSGRSVLCAYIGLVGGDLVSGLLSQYFKSRKKVLAAFVVLTGLCCVLYLRWPHVAPSSLYVLAIPLGFSVGYWAVFVTSAAEQFGINLRATVTTTVPNFVRGAVVLIIPIFNMLKAPLGILNAALAVSLTCVVIALGALTRLHESFHKDLDFIEHS